MVKDGEKSMDDVEFERLKQSFWQHLDQEMKLQARVDTMNGAQKIELNAMILKHPYGRRIIEKAKAELDKIKARKTETSPR